VGALCQRPPREDAERRFQATVASPSGVSQSLQRGVST
jgi:hypothetical protein